MKEGPSFGIRKVDDTVRNASISAFGMPQISEGKNTIVAKFDLPDVNREDLELKVTEDAIQLKVRKQYDKEIRKDGFYRRESMSKSFFRSYPLPSKIDTKEIVTEFKDGILKIGMKKQKADIEYAKDAK